jgi:hypothetical protein
VRPLLTLLVALNIILLVVAAAPRRPKIVTVSELDVVDSNGVVRARIAGNLPETYSGGKPIGRNAAGVLLYDKAGKERGGYVTFGNDHVALTLDSRNEMTGIFVAGPTGGAALTLNDGQNLTEMRIDPENGPTIHALRDHEVVFHEPRSAKFAAAGDCSELREIAKTKGRPYALDACRRRSAEEECQACLRVP